MTEICALCKKPIKQGESSISLVRNQKKQWYHPRCFGAQQMADQARTKADSPELHKAGS